MKELEITAVQPIVCAAIGPFSVLLLKAAPSPGSDDVRPLLANRTVRPVAVIPSRRGVP